MLYYQFNGYEGFKEIFGMQEHGNGVKSRRNKILLALLTSREFIHAVRTTAWNKGERTVRAFNGVGVSCINISCGYYNPHTDQECTVWSELKNALDFARHICATLTDRYPHEYTDAWSAWDDGWYGFGRRRKRKASSYTAFDEDMDYDTMDSILRYETHLTFEEVAKNYAGHFVTQDMDLLRCIYDDVLAYCVKNAQDDAPKLPFEDSKL